MNQEIAVTDKKPAQIELVKQFFERDNVKSRFAEMLGKRAPQFLTSVLQIVASNDMLKNADVNSIYNAAATAATLDLPLNNNLGFAYIVPYNQKYQDENGNWLSKQVAQFQIGWKGFVQLAQRTGLYETIAVTPIYEYQIISHNPLTGIKFDFTIIKSEKVVGYAAYFKLITGFEKTLYMSVDEIKAHAKKYSQTYSSSKKHVVEKSRWTIDFPNMACKTTIKQLISKWGPLSVAIEKALITDQSVITDYETMAVEYADNPAIAEGATIEELESLYTEKYTLMSPDQILNADRILNREKPETGSFANLKKELESL